MPLLSGIQHAFNTVQFSGKLYARNVGDATFFNTLGPTRKTRSDEFTIGTMYDAKPIVRSQISVEDTFKAPPATFVTLENVTNITQIYHRRISESMLLPSNLDRLDGLNLAQQTNNVLDNALFQINLEMDNVIQTANIDMIFGKYKKATKVNEYREQRGLLQSITSNVIDAAGAEFDPSMLARAMLRRRKYKMDFNKNYTLLVNSAWFWDLYKIYKEFVVTQVGIENTIAGSQYYTIVVPGYNGQIKLMAEDALPGDTMVGYFPDLMSPVEQEIYDRRTGAWRSFFVGDLAMEGLVDERQLAGQLGLDYGPEFFNFKIINLKPPTLIADVPIVFDVKPKTAEELEAESKALEEAKAAEIAAQEAEAKALEEAKAAKLAEEATKVKKPKDQPNQ